MTNRSDDILLDEVPGKQISSNLLTANNYYTYLAPTDGSKGQCIAIRFLLKPICGHFICCIRARTIDKVVQLDRYMCHSIESAISANSGDEHAVIYLHEPPLRPRWSLIQSRFLLLNHALQLTMLK